MRLINQQTIPDVNCDIRRADDLLWLDLLLELTLHTYIQFILNDAVYGFVGSAKSKDG